MTSRKYKPHGNLHLSALLIAFMALVRFLLISFLVWLTRTMTRSMVPFGISGVVAYCDDFFLFIPRFCWSRRNMFYIDSSLTLCLVWLEWLSFGGSLVVLSFHNFFFSFLLFSGSRFTNIYPGFILLSFVPVKVPSLSCSPDCFTSWNLAWNFLHFGTANKELYSFLTIFPCLLCPTSFTELDFNISF